MGHYTLIAPVGGDLQSLFVGLREYPTKKLVLLYTKTQRAQMAQIKNSLSVFGLPIETHELGDNLLNDTLNVMLSLGREGDDLIVNTSTGDASLASVVLSVASIVGIKAFTVVNNTPLLLPSFKLNIPKLVSKKKVEILKTLLAGPLSASELRRRVKISAPLLSYHLNGDRNSQGLVDIGLVEVKGGSRRKLVALSNFGRLLLKFLNI